MFTQKELNEVMNTLVNSNNKDKLIDLISENDKGFVIINMAIEIKYLRKELELYKEFSKKAIANLTFCNTKNPKDLTK